LISGIYVDKDLPADYGAVTYGCADFTPPSGWHHMHVRT